MRNITWTFQTGAGATTGSGGTGKAGDIKNRILASGKESTSGSFLWAIY